MKKTKTASKKNVYITLKNEVIQLLNVDSDSNHRSFSRHIAWIIDKYFDELINDLALDKYFKELGTSSDNISAVEKTELLAALKKQVKKEMLR